MPAAHGDTTTDPPTPAGFPRCADCAYRRLARPEVCLACYRHSGPAPSTGPAAAGCAACGQRLVAGRGCTNRWCSRADRAWSVVFTIGVHEGALRRVLVAYKYKEQRWWSAVLSRLVAGWLTAHQPWLEDFDLVVPVPAYLGPGGRRAWDPVGELAGGAAKLVGALWEFAPGAVVKTAETPPMTNRSHASRLAVAQGPLRAALRVPDAARVRGARVLVLDDVVTDGATLREVARVLRAAGACEVAGLALTRPPWSAPTPGPTVAGCRPRPP